MLIPTLLRHCKPIVYYTQVHCVSVDIVHGGQRCKQHKNKVRAIETEKQQRQIIEEKKAAYAAFVRGNGKHGAGATYKIPKGKNGGAPPRK